MEFTYGLFGFEFSLELSTRPDNYLGQIETWNEAEAVSPSPCPPRISLHPPVLDSAPGSKSTDCLFLHGLKNPKMLSLDCALVENVVDVTSNSGKRLRNTTLGNGRSTRETEHSTVQR